MVDTNMREDNDVLKTYGMSILNFRHLFQSVNLEMPEQIKVVLEKLSNLGVDLSVECFTWVQYHLLALRHGYANLTEFVCFQSIQHP